MDLQPAADPYNVVCMVMLPPEWSGRSTNVVWNVDS